MAPNKQVEGQGLSLTATQQIPYDPVVEEYLPAIEKHSPVSPRDTTFHFSPQAVRYFAGQGVLPYQFDQTRGNVTFALDKDMYEEFITPEDFKVRFSELFSSMGQELRNLTADNNRIKFVFFPAEVIDKLAPYIANPEMIASYKTQRKAEADINQGMISNTETNAYVDNLISRAIEERVSDIHVESMGGLERRIRFRVDGDLKVIPSSMSPSVYKSVVAVLKNRCGAGIKVEEHRRPQDGKLSFTSNTLDAEGKPEIYDLRSAFAPVMGGEENAILRLARRGAFKNRTQLELYSHDSDRIAQLCDLPNGIILVTGPTGSGKTTTIYAMLKDINKPDVKVITIEDPVELQMPGLQQTQVLKAVGLDFDSYLSNILRMDPDVVFVGEIRNGETANMAIEASKTGHLVVSTLHTNNAVGAVNRLKSKEMGVSKIDLAENLRGVLAQTLVSVFEEGLRQRILSGNLTEEDFKQIEHHDGGLALNQLTGEDIYQKDSFYFYKSTGLAYLGRQPLTELWVIDENSEDAIENPDAGRSALTKTAEESGMHPMFISGVEKVMAGKTSLDNVLRAVGSSVFKRKKDLLRKYIQP